MDFFLKKTREDSVGLRAKEYNGLVRSVFQRVGKKITERKKKAENRTVTDAYGQ